MKELFIDASQDQCPIPVVKAKKALESLDGPGQVEIRVGNATAVENLKRLAAGAGLPISVSESDGGRYSVIITAEAPLPANSPSPLPEMTCAPGSGTVVAIGSNTMGQGDDQLGAVLMKGFIYALAQQEESPRTVIFFNDGAKLTVSGSASLEDLQVLADRGTEILTCGTCLNYYGLSDQLAVGKVTNMYDIVDMLISADKVIKL